MIQETLKIAGSSDTSYEKPRGAQRSTEMAGATEGIQSAEEGGSPLKDETVMNINLFFFYLVQNPEYP